MLKASGEATLLLRVYFAAKASRARVVAQQSSKPRLPAAARIFVRSAKRYSKGWIAVY